MLNKEFKCLNYGFVRLVDMMGDDFAIVQAARTSYGKGTKTINADKNLIRYLMRNKHTSPFEMVEFKFHIKLPIFVARQWIRHRTANVNEYSGRYSEMPDEFYIPDANNINYQSTNNKQVRSSEIYLDDDVIKKFENTQQNAYNEYKNFIDNGMAREIARINLPLSIFTEWYWKIDLHNLFHFLRLRLDKHSQYEIRVYAEVIAEILKELVPISYSAFEDYILNAISFSATELNILKEIINGSVYQINRDLLSDYGLSKGESEEFLNKIELIKEKNN